MLSRLTLFCNLRSQFELSDTTSNRLSSVMFHSSLSGCMFCSFCFHALVYRSFFWQCHSSVRRFCSNAICQLSKQPDAHLRCTQLIFMRMLEANSIYTRHEFDSDAENHALSDCYNFRHHYLSRNNYNNARGERRVDHSANFCRLWKANRRVPFTLRHLTRR